MTLKEMRDKRRELTDKGRKLTNLAETENRELTSEEAVAFEDLMATVEDLTAKIGREERLYRHETDQDLPNERSTRPDLDANEQRVNRGGPQRFASFGEQMQAVMRAGRDPRHTDPRLDTRAISGLNEGVPADGGFLVQTDFATELLRRTYETGQVASRCRRIGISANANGLKMNGINETSRANGSRWGGVKVYWTAEAGDKTGTLPQFRQIELNLKKLTGLCYATDELLADANALESVLMQAFSEEFGFRLDDAIINGAGGGMPQGILGSAALVTVAIEGGQLADTILAENLVKIWSRCYNRSRLNAVWFIN